MKNVHRVVGLLFLGVAVASGCGTPSPKKIEARAGLKDAPIGEHTPAIRAAAASGFSADRRDTLVEVAGQPDLQEPDQRRILAVLRARPGFSGDNTAVLLTLVNNPACTRATRLEIGDTLDKMVAFSEDRRQVAAALVR